MKKVLNVGVGFLSLTILGVLAFVLFNNPSEQTASGQEGDGKGAQQEGVQVHGDWTIEVVNEDGTVAEKKAFQNALVEDGSKMLANILTGQNTLGRWKITLDGGDQSICENYEAYTDGVECIIIEPDSLGSQEPGVISIQDPFTNLSITPHTSGENAGSIVLSGSVDSSYDGEIKTVGTSLTTCESSKDPDSCGSLQFSLDDYNDFTQHTFTGSDVIDVVEGQSVNVTVVLSFD